MDGSRPYAGWTGLLVIGSGLVLGVVGVARLIAFDPEVSDRLTFYSASLQVICGAVVAGLAFYLRRRSFRSRQGRRTER